jgi:hypothetical protein
MDTVQRQIDSYRQSLNTVRQLRDEAQADSVLNGRLSLSPESMATVLVERGIPIFLAVSIAGEDHVDPNFGTALAIWTWDCCTTGCCISCFGASNNANAIAREPISLDACFGRRVAG